MIKKVKVPSKWISTIAIHPGGEHFLVGGYDRKVIWCVHHLFLFCVDLCLRCPLIIITEIVYAIFFLRFEMEYTNRPLTLRYHREAVRSAVYHRKYPLFATAADDGRVIVSHGTVYE